MRQRGQAVRPFGFRWLGTSSVCSVVAYRVSTCRFATLPSTSAPKEDQLPPSSQIKSEDKDDPSKQDHVGIAVDPLWPQTRAQLHRLFHFATVPLNSGQKCDPWVADDERYFQYQDILESYWPSHEWMAHLRWKARGGDADRDDDYIFEDKLEIFKCGIAYRADQLKVLSEIQNKDHLKSPRLVHGLYEDIMWLDSLHKELKGHEVRSECISRLVPCIFEKEKDEWDEGQPDIETELRELLRINTHAKFDDFQFDFMHLNSKERRACDNITEALKRREALLSELTDPQGFSIGMGQVWYVPCFYLGRTKHGRLAGFIANFVKI